MKTTAVMMKATITIAGEDEYLTDDKGGEDHKSKCTQYCSSCGKYEEEDGYLTDGKINAWNSMKKLEAQRISLERKIEDIWQFLEDI
eukprot:15343520-Ditylum_brightwellii.AAC.1